VLGVEALAVDVEIDISNGLPSFTTVRTLRPYGRE
jgi:hypothetical protein